MAETELKLLIDRATVDAVWDRARGAGMTAARPRPRQMRSIYFDTPDHALYAARVALRLRRDRGRWLQTAKAKSSLSGGLSQSGEWEAPARGGRIDLDLIADAEMQETLAALVAGKPLAPVCETRIRRQAGEISLGGARAELAVDRGEIVAGDRAAPFCELEIELLEGSPTALYDIAALLLPEGGVRFSDLSKAQRGYLLAAEGRIAPPLTPRRARAAPLTPGMTTEQAARRALRECLGQIAENVAVVLATEDPEGPHQLRIGLRRLRSVLSIFAPALKGAEAARLKAAARDLGRAVGVVRDLDVTAEDVVARHAADAPEEPGFALLSAALATRRATARAVLRERLKGRETQGFLFALARFTETGGWRDAADAGQPKRLLRPAETTARRALRKAWKAIERRARGLDRLNVEERHDLRKALKGMRYATEFLAPLLHERRARKFLKAAKKLQSLFGKLNDLAMVESLLAGPEAVCAGDPAARRAAERILDAAAASAARDWRRAATSWRTLAARSGFWKQAVAPRRAAR